MPPLGGLADVVEALANLFESLSHEDRKLPGDAKAIIALCEGLVQDELVVGKVDARRSQNAQGTAHSRFGNDFVVHDPGRHRREFTFAVPVVNPGLARLLV